MTYTPFLKHRYRPRSPIEYWLWRRGGRTMEDVLYDEGMAYVYMWDGREKLDVKVYVPLYYLKV